MNAADLLNAGRSYGLVGQGCKVEIDDLRQVKLPAILHWELNHFVLLESWSKRSSVIVDPGLGRRSVTLAELDRAFTGIVLELSPGPGFRRRKRKSLSYKRYRAALMRSSGALGYVVVSNALGQLLAICHPAAMQFFIDQVIGQARREWILPVAACMIASTIVQATLGILRRKSESILHAKLGLELSVELARHLLALPLPFLDARSRGDLINRVQMQDELRTIAARASQSFFDLLLVLMLGGLMLAYHQTLGAVALSMIAARILAVRVSRAQAAASHQTEQLARGKAAAALMEATAHPEMVKGLGLEPEVAQRFERRTQRHATAAVRAGLAERRIARMLALLNGGTEAALLWLGGYFALGGGLTLGEFAGFLAIRQLIETPLASVVAVFEELGELRNAFERSDEILSTPQEPVGHHQTKHIVGQMQLRDVGFRYGNGGAWVFRHVNLTIRAGEHVVIVGPSGAGKSTLLKILCGIVAPTEGEVLLDGRPLPHYSPDSLRETLGVVLQEPLILPGTIEDALRVRVLSATREEIARAAELAALRPVLVRAPDGFSSKLTVGATNLSGGERQRLALAQALVGSPSVLLLDEATCALDEATEAAVLDNLANLKATTTVAVAHRAAVIERAARILTVSDGKLTDAKRIPSLRSNRSSRHDLIA